MLFESQGVLVDCCGILGGFQSANCYTGCGCRSMSNIGIIFKCIYIYIFLSQVDDFKYNVLHITALSYSIGSFCYSSCHKIYNGVTCQSPRCKRVQWIVSIGSAGMSCRSWNM